MKEEIDKFFTKEYKEEILVNDRHIYHTLKKLVKGDLLDLGSGSGRWLEIVGHGDSCDAYNDNVDYKINLDDGFNLPKKYDAITAFGVMYYLSSPYRFLASVKKHLNGGGIFIVGFNFHSYKHKFRIKYYFSKESSRRTLEENGFKIIKTYRNGFISPKLNFLQPFWKMISKQFIFYVCKVKDENN